MKREDLVIVGTGATGLSCADYYLEKSLPFMLVDTREEVAGLAKLQDLYGAKNVKVGAEAEAVIQAAKVLVVSPGVSLTEAPIKLAVANGAVISSDIEIFMSEVSVPVVGITGSNGKSTVTTLVGEMLLEAGMQCGVGGNIGIPALHLLKEKSDVYVLELSSFQLERINNIGLEVAVILNVTEDHMDRYSTFEEYVAAKQKIFESGNFAIVNRDDGNTKVSGELKVIEFGLGASFKGYGIVDNQRGQCISFDGKEIMPVEKLKIKGRHNIANVMAAMAVARCFDIAWDVLEKAASKFTGLKHRCQWVATIGGVDFYNDSKATNVGAVIAAVNGMKDYFKQIVLIAGGVDKDSDFKPLAECVRESVSSVILFGQDAAKIEAAIGKDLCVLEEDLEAAVRTAKVKVGQEGLVLFSPACASFDMFKNFEERGDAFIHAVNALA